MNLLSNWYLNKSIIATEAQAVIIGGQGTSTANKMCTKNKAVSCGCKISGTYADNQLVQYADLSKARTYVEFDIVYRWRVNGWNLGFLSIGSYLSYQFTYDEVGQDLLDHMPHSSYFTNGWNYYQARYYAAQIMVAFVNPSGNLVMCSSSSDLAINATAYSRLTITTPSTSNPASSQNCTWGIFLRISDA